MKGQRNKKSGRRERFSHVRKIYDAFAVKDMDFKTFKRAYEKETSAVNGKRELKELVRFRSHQRTQRMVADQSRSQIDQRLEN